MERRREGERKYICVNERERNVVRRKRRHEKGKGDERENRKVEKKTEQDMRGMETRGEEWKEERA